MKTAVSRIIGIIMLLPVYTTASAQNPERIYDVSGAYTVSLNTANSSSQTDTGDSNVFDINDNDFTIINDDSRDLLQTIIDNSVNYYRKLKQISQLPGYELIIVSNENWVNHTAKVRWNFEAGYIEGDKLYATVPHTAAQLEVFPTIESVIRYTVAKAMLLKHLAANAPEWFQYGYAAYEAQLARPYKTIRGIYAAAGKFPDLSDFDSFDPENNFEQRDLAFSMGEYAMLIHGDYPKFPSFYNGRITLLTANQTKANDLWHLFLEKHYLESAERVKILVKNEKIAIYGASKDSAKAPLYLESLTSQLQFYEDSFKVAATHRINVLINPDRCTQLLVEGYECDNNQGGGGHGSGLGGCAFISPSFNNYRDFNWLMTHEFTHVYQFWMKSNFMPAWLSEGFASCMPKIRVQDAFEYLKHDMYNKWTVVRRNLGRDPTISELMDYAFVRNNNIDYYGIGWLMIDYIVKKDGYLAVRKIIESNGYDFSSMGFGSKEDFMRYFYHYFDIRIMRKEIITLTSPEKNMEYSTTNIDIRWTALSGNIPLDLEVSINGGGQWTTLLSGTKDSQFTWAVPSEFTGDF